jgi:hypothetical protein
MERRKIFILIGIVQILSLIYSLPFYIRLTLNIIIHPYEFILFDGLQIGLLLIIISSIVLYFRQSRYALRIYYLEFILRILFFTTTFGYFVMLNFVFHNQAFYDILRIFVVILEILRLITSIILDVKWTKSLNGA